MCLLAVMWESHPDFPLLIGANRDEFLTRPAIPMSVLQDAGPRVLGGRDELAGGTWLAVNEHGVVAGLTNRPAGESGRDPTKRSRGEIPIALARCRTAEAAASWFVESISPADYNPAWVLVADRDGLFYLDMTGEAAAARPLPPGVHAIENRPIDADSPKAEMVRARVQHLTEVRGDDVVDAMRSILSSHQTPERAPEGAPTDASRQVGAACVHTEKYGTRWSAVIRVPPSAGPPLISYTDGPPCITAPADASFGL